MDSIILFVLASLFTHPLSLIAQPTNLVSKITVVGVVYCDICSSNTFSRHSSFLPGADVQIRCKFKTNSPQITEHTTFSVNKTTDKHGVYKVEIANIDGVNCVEGLAATSFCQVTLLGSSSSTCNVPGSKTTSTVMTFKSKEENRCIYNLNTLSYRPSEKNTALCANKQELSRSFNASKSFLPYMSPYLSHSSHFPSLQFSSPPFPSFPFPPLPPFPPFPAFPFPPRSPFPSFPFPPFPSFPFPPRSPFPSFPFPPIPPSSSLPPQSSPAPSSGSP
ncbi:hypothetical protein RGQ29_015180 [Quercus rubra]|uniref:Uncharacterized protein n=1 Tax=Quercus rubra TaxID=3512 RepID=A0AAN7FPC5_QUERU|nr:hypothetical protein RGQ29_015180 [Quercus rubra]